MEKGGKWNQKGKKTLGRKVLENRELSKLKKGIRLQEKKSWKDKDYGHKMETEVENFRDSSVSSNEKVQCLVMEMTGHYNQRGCTACFGW